MAAVKKTFPHKRGELPEGYRSGVRVCVNADVLVPKGSRGIICDFDERFWNGYTVPVQINGRSRHFAIGELDIVEDEKK